MLHSRPTSESFRDSESTRQRVNGLQTIDSEHLERTLEAAIQGGRSGNPGNDSHRPSEIAEPRDGARLLPLPTYAPTLSHIPHLYHPLLTFELYKVGIVLKTRCKMK